jgi:hypothetical protein
MAPLELQPTAQSSYARTLIERGCPHNLAHSAAHVLANVDGQRPRTFTEQATVERAWASVSR